MSSTALHAPALHAVLTGDVIGSRHMSGPRGALAGILRRVAQTLQAGHRKDIPHALAIFRGDGWQLYLRSPALALRAAVRFRAAVRVESALLGSQVDTRVAVAIDTVDYIDTDDLSASDGPAFQRSGEALEGIGEADLACVLPDQLPEAYHLAAAQMTDTADHLLGTWTLSQAQAVLLKLQPGNGDDGATQAHIAASWRPQPITQPAVSKHLLAARWDLLAATLGRFDRLIAATGGPAAVES